MNNFSFLLIQFHNVFLKFKFYSLHISLQHTTTQIKFNPTLSFAKIGHPNIKTHTNLTVFNKTFNYICYSGESHKNSYFN